MAAQELATTSLFTDPTLIAYYKAENVNDSKASFNLTNHNSVAFNPAKFNNGFDFGSSNTNKYVDIANNLGLNTYQAGIWSWVGWVNLSTQVGSGAEYVLFFVENNLKAQAQLLYGDYTGVKQLSFTIYNGTTAQTFKTYQTLNTSTWYHLAVVKNGTSVKIYVNGVLIDTETLTIADASPGRPNQVVFGIDTFDSNYGPLCGLMDDLAFFSKALTAAEIANLAVGTGVTSFAPVAGANSPVDGYVHRDGVDESLSTIKAGAGTFFDNTQTSLFARLNSSSTSNQFSAMDRAIMCFNTAVLTAGATIVSAVLNLWVTSITTPLGTVGFSLVVVGATPAATNTLANSDYGQVGTTYFDFKNYADIVAGAYNPFTFNAAGKASINKTGVSKFGAVTGWDYNNTFNGTWAPNANAYYDILSADGLTHPPILTVTYTLPQGGAFLINFI